MHTPLNDFSACCGQVAHYQKAAAAAAIAREDATVAALLVPGVSPVSSPPPIAFPSSNVTPDLAVTASA